MAMQHPRKFKKELWLGVHRPWPCEHGIDIGRKVWVILLNSVVLRIDNDTVGKRVYRLGIHRPWPCVMGREP